MRISPLPFYLLKKFGSVAMEKKEAFEVVHNVSSLTHAHAIALVACDIYCAFMIEILNGKAKEELLQSALKKVSDFVNANPKYAATFEKYDRLQCFRRKLLINILDK